jgi:hypothetical protein
MSPMLCALYAALYEDYSLFTWIHKTPHGYIPGAIGCTNDNARVKLTQHFINQ